MADKKKTFVGFGFGPIQSGLFLYEAFRSGNFDRYVVAEIDQAIVDAIRRNGGAYTVNIARRDRIDTFVVRGVEMLNPQIDADREKLLDAIASADELATALPSVRIFDLGGEKSVAGNIVAGLRRRKTDAPAIIYAAENNNHAAEILTECMKKLDPAVDFSRVQVLNTVIGKMSGVIGDAEEIAQLKLATMTSDLPRAILIEEFNRILVSKVTLNYTLGIDVFAEKPDLLPFEEAKLYGHNAIHAMMAYLADCRGLRTMAQIADHADILAVARQAFIDESGASLIKKYASLGDALFTDAGYRAYADDLLERMVCPYLNDLISRVGRDHVRKLSYDDRIYGTMRLALQHGVRPIQMARGAAAGVLCMIRRRDEQPKTLDKLPSSGDNITRDELKNLLYQVWSGKETADGYAETLVELTWEAMQSLR
jgi:mannitol-1-phosphate 5-dehydrogenase